MISILRLGCCILASAFVDMLCYVSLFRRKRRSLPQKAPDALTFEHHVISKPPLSCRQCGGSGFLQVFTYLTTMLSFSCSVKRSWFRLCAARSCSAMAFWTRWCSHSADASAYECWGIMQCHPTRLPLSTVTECASGLIKSHTPWSVCDAKQTKAHTLMSSRIMCCAQSARSAI